MPDSTPGQEALSALTGLHVRLCSSLDDKLELAVAVSTLRSALQPRSSVKSTTDSKFKPRKVGTSGAWTIRRSRPEAAAAAAGTSSKAVTETTVTTLENGIRTFCETNSAPEVVATLLNDWRALQSSRLTIFRDRPFPLPSSFSSDDAAGVRQAYVQNHCVRLARQKTRLAATTLLNGGNGSDRMPEAMATVLRSMAGASVPGAVWDSAAANTITVAFTKWIEAEKQKRVKGKGKKHGALAPDDHRHRVFQAWTESLQQREWVVDNVIAAVDEAGR